MAVQRKCMQCDKNFTATNSQVKKGTGKFCSLSCGTTYRNIHNNPTKDPKVREKISKNHADVSGENNPMYGMKGILAPSFIDGRSTFKGQTYRNIALANLPHECRLCDEKDLAKLHVHHKDGNRKNNELDNLVFLCVKCHNTKAHIYIRDERGLFVGSKLNEEVVI